jgi:hypothetical protein
LDHNANVIQSGAVVGSAATYIVSKIAGVIRAKKHVKRQPFTDRIGQSNNIIVTNSENVTIEMPFEIYELFKSGTLDADLAKITSPLVQGKIDAAELEARSVDATVLRERIEASERPYFDTTVTTVTSTQPIWIVAKLNSLTKSTNSGYLWLTDGTRVFYRYTGDSAAKLYSLFPYDIPVRVFCVAHQDANFKTASVDILDIERAQGELFPHSIEEPESPEEDSTP